MRKKRSKVLVYSKWCFECEHPDEFSKIRNWGVEQDAEVKVVRTAYHPIRHKKAVQLWAQHIGKSEEEAADYSVFVVYDATYSLKEFIKMISDAKNKMVTGGKTKNDVHRLPKTKRSSREDRSMVSDMGNSQENEVDDGEAKS